MLSNRHTDTHRPSTVTLTAHVRRGLISGSGLQFYHTKAVIVKLSGDETTINKKLHVVNLHSLLQGQSTYSSEGNHTLAIKELPWW